MTKNVDTFMLQTCCKKRERFTYLVCVFERERCLYHGAILDACQCAKEPLAFFVRLPVHNTRHKCFSNAFEKHLCLVLCITCGLLASVFLRWSRASSESQRRRDLIEAHERRTQGSKRFRDGLQRGACQNLSLAQSARERCDSK